jgi:Ca-activated chloride channel family protein
VSFAEPLWLLSLLLIPLALLAQRGIGRCRARTYAVRFTAVSTLRQAIEMGGRRWRAAAAALFLAAVALLAIGLSRPHVTHRVPINKASLILVLDHSGSMAATDVRPTRIQAAISAANSFIDQLPKNIRLGFVGFSSSPDTAQRPTTDHQAVRSLIDQQYADGGTDTGPALQTALQLLDASKKLHPPAAIVLLSDGAANEGISPVTVAGVAKTEQVPIYTVALGTAQGVLQEGPFGQEIPVPPDPALMRAIATTSGGRSFDAQTADDLSSVYKALGQKLSTVARKRDLTVWVLIAAAVLLLLAAAASTRTRSSFS